MNALYPQLAQWRKGISVAKIPDAVSLLAQVGTKRPWDDPSLAAAGQLLVAAILRLQVEDDEAALIITQAELVKAGGFTLITTVIPEDNAVVLTVRPK